VTAHIPLASDLIPLVLNGQKTSTVRIGTRNYLPGPALIVSGGSQIPVNITDVEFTKFGDLDQAVAKAEGYDTLAELLDVILRFYPTATNDADVTIVRFKLR
jgi:hypothetical protein